MRNMDIFAGVETNIKRLMCVVFDGIMVEPYDRPDMSIVVSKVILNYDSIKSQNKKFNFKKIETDSIMVLNSDANSFRKFIYTNVKNTPTYLNLINLPISIDESIYTPDMYFLLEKIPRRSIKNIRFVDPVLANQKYEKYKLPFGIIEVTVIN